MVARLAMLFCLLAVIAYAGSQYWQVRQASAAQKQTEADAVRATGLIDIAPKKLASGFTDESGTLLADAPKDPAKWLDPAKLVIAHLAAKDADADTPEVDWAEFDAHLSQATGKPVSDIEVENGPSEIDNIKSGKITLMALHGVDAPFLVNNCGFHPIAVLGDDHGIWGNRLDLIVPSNSAITKAADLKGKTLTCTGPRSIVGYRAAIVLLMQNEKLRPNVDYFIDWTQGQTESIEGVAKGTYEIAAVSDEKLHSLEESQKQNKKIKPSQYHLVYQSDVFPRTTIGYFYNLKPELAAKVQDAILSYKPAATNGNEQPMHFLKVDYRKDFALVRNIDDRFDPRLEPKVKHSSSPVGPTTGPGPVVQ
jgi:phosphonate transport system substrate-binding protein